MRFQKFHKMSILRSKTDVRDLNTIGHLASLSNHEHWPLRTFANPRLCALAKAFRLNSHRSQGTEPAGTLHRTLQLLSIRPFEKIPVHELLAENDFRHSEPLDSNKLMLRNL